MVAELSPSAALVVGLDEVKVYLKIEHAHEDALIAGLIRTATAMCEAFTGQLLLTRAVKERLPASREWQPLNYRPVKTVENISDQHGVLFSDTKWQARIDRNGDAWVSLSDNEQTVMQVAYSAGQADSWNGIPEPLRQGIIRLVAHMHLYRDDAEGGAPPSVVAALWRPWRRMRLQ